eukprot:CAMPEP_0174836704 /NCGR_PEP_ID=MMETSP1114-20130205/6241_1 /TAXON_ID=312471 /ORGANISM="Neobodo designis, Strain CCAP 1951/1" /LENGTH=593 /DNA_ID=CAMNT_0016070711 /DNA_START=186 /DNA_END=1967 /DNA_ORIENTATION=+
MSQHSFHLPTQNPSTASFASTGGARSRGASVQHPPTARVQLFFAATRLADMDLLSKSDPYVVIDALQGPGVPVRRNVGRTETIRDDLNPSWKTPIAVDYHFELPQNIAFTVYDDDGKGTAGDDVLARGTFLLAHVVSGRNSTLEVPLQPRGTLRIHAQELTASRRDTVCLQFAAAGLTSKALWGAGNNCRLRIHRVLPNGTKSLAYTSEVRPNTADPRWSPTPALKTYELTANAPSAGRHPILIECVHVRSGPFGSEKKLGQVATSLDALIADAGPNVLRNMPAPSNYQTTAAVPTGPLTLVHPTKPGKSYGQLHVAGATVDHVASFTELLGAGLKMNLAVAIDFTASNGDPADASSLHYHRHGGTGYPDNEYFRATQSVADILMEYDSDKMVPCFGFGAVVPNGARGSLHSVSHCFHLNGKQDPHVHDVKGILDAYLFTLSRVRLSGPTHFAPVIQQATRAARATPDEYAVLLILTDGCINDTDATVDAIVDAADAPLSIVIVGVGQADFTLMRMLDGDDRALRHSDGRVCRRDLVQFVPFRDFARSPRYALAAEVLAEVPRQVEDWAHQCGYVPPGDDGATARGARHDPLL